MRRSDHPNCPSAITCCFLSSLKTLLTLTQGNSRVRINVLDQTFVGRFSSDNHWPHLSDYRGSERSMDQMCESMDKNRIQGVSVGRAGNLSRSPYPSRVRNVDSATVHRRQRNLPQEICSVSLRRLKLPKGGLIGEQKSAEGIVGHAVGKASEALNVERRSQQIGQAGNGD